MRTKHAIVVPVAPREVFAYLADVANNESLRARHRLQLRKGLRDDLDRLARLLPSIAS